MKTLIAKQDTALKKSTEQTKNLKEADFIEFSAGQKLNILAKRPVDLGHEFVTLDQSINGRNSWFLFPGHWEEEGAATELKMTFRYINTVDSYGGPMFRLDMHMGQDKLTLQMGSGVCGSYPIPVSRDYPGSGNPIPQGTYSLGKTVRESLSDMDPRIGPIWIPLTPLTDTNGRDGFLIHMDYNYERSPGTLGCPFPQRNRDMYTIADWNDRAKSGTLFVEYGF